MRRTPSSTRRSRLRAAQAPTAAAAGFVNAILRNFLRRRESLLEALQQDEQVVYNAPSWWIDAMRAAHPADWRELLTRGQQQPPLVLRVNRRRTNVAVLSAAARRSWHGGDSRRPRCGLAAPAAAGRRDSRIRRRRSLGPGRRRAARGRLARRARRHACARCMRCTGGQDRASRRTRRTRPDGGRA